MFPLFIRLVSDFFRLLLMAPAVAALTLRVQQVLRSVAMHSTLESKDTRSPDCKLKILADTSVLAKGGTPIVATAVDIRRSSSSQRDTDGFLESCGVDTKSAASVTPKLASSIAENTRLLCVPRATGGGVSGVTVPDALTTPAQQTRQGSTDASPARQKLMFDDPLDTKVYFLKLRQQEPSSKEAAPPAAALPCASAGCVLGNITLNTVMTANIVNSHCLAAPSQRHSFDSVVDRFTQHRRRSRRGRQQHTIPGHQPQHMQPAVNTKRLFTSSLHPCTLENHSSKGGEAFAGISSGRVRLTAGGQVVLHRNRFCC